MAKILNNSKNNKSEFTGIWIPREIALRDDLNISERVIISIIIGLSKSGKVYISNHRLSEYTGIHHVSISRIISRLQDKKLIQIKSFAQGRSRVITINKTLIVELGLLTKGLDYSKQNVNRSINKTLTHIILDNKEDNKEIQKKKKPVNNKPVKSKIPDFEEFQEYAKTLEIYHSSMAFQLKAKYTAWIENKWKDGNGRPIKNWKTKLQNTMVYFKAARNNVKGNYKDISHENYTERFSDL